MVTVVGFAPVGVAARARGNAPAGVAARALCRRTITAAPDRAAEMDVGIVVVVVVAIAGIQIVRNSRRFARRRCLRPLH